MLSGNKMTPHSRPEQIAGQIHEKILSGALMPGQRILEGGLSRELQAGQPTVREALMRLERQGLVKRVANLGTFVIDFDLGELRDLFQIRARLEVLAWELAARGAQPADRDELHTIARGMEMAAAAGDLMGYLHRDLAFHRIVWQLSGNRRLAEMLETIVTPLLAVLMHKTKRSLAETVKSAQAHRKLADALLEGPEAAAEAMRSHVGAYYRNHLARELFHGSPPPGWEGGF